MSERQSLVSDINSTSTEIIDGGMKMSLEEEEPQDQVNYNNNSFISTTKKTPVFTRGSEDLVDMHANDDCNGLAPVVHFLDLVIVRSPTVGPHVRYSMEIVSPTTSEHFYLAKRFSQFYKMRKELFTIKCTPYTSKSPACLDCQMMMIKLKKNTKSFPRRKLITKVKHVKDRAIPLEHFLRIVMDVAATWTGCLKGKKRYTKHISEFIGEPTFFLNSLPIMEDIQAREDNEMNRESLAPSGYDARSSIANLVHISRMTLTRNDSKDNEPLVGLKEL